MSPNDRSTEPVAEVAVRLRVNGAHVIGWSCSPAALEALGAGRLMALGFLADPDDIMEVRVLPPENGIHQIDARVPPGRVAAATEERDHRREHGCGLRFLVHCRPDLLQRNGEPVAAPELDTFPELFRELFERSPSRRTTGGHHTTALSDGSRLLHVHEEVGRHNGADKAIGSALLAHSDLSRLGLVTTARISGEIAEKAARSGLAWVASRSVPTTMAVQIGRAAGMALVARAAGKEARVFS